MSNLVLSRRLGEVIVINKLIKVKVIGIGLTQVKLLIDAPKDIPIMREELIDGSRQDHSTNPSKD